MPASELDMWAVEQERTDLFMFCNSDSGAHLWDVNTGLERHDQCYSTLWISSMQSETLVYCISFLILVLLYFYKNH